MNKTLVWIRDSSGGAQGPEGDTGPAFFNVYDDAMSWAKFMDHYWIGSGQIVVWNKNGGSGFWEDSVWTATENKNYPS